MRLLVYGFFIWSFFITCPDIFFGSPAALLRASPLAPCPDPYTV